jgi:NADH-quinone oxidoreductase subunit L
MTSGVFAIAGIWPFAGFFSKDEILYQTFISDNPIGKLLWLVGLVTAGMTSFYMFRLWFKTFFGEERFEEHGHDAHGHDSHSHGVHESPWVMLLPLVILGVLSLIGGWGHVAFGNFLDPVFGAPAEAATAASHGIELTLVAVSLIVVAIGFFVAWLFYYKKPGTAGALALKAKPLYSLLENKYWVDEFYGLIVTGLLMFTRMILAGLVDTGLVNGSGALAGATTRGLSTVTRRVQSGNIRSYAGWLALGAAAILVVMIFGRSLWVH